MPSLRRDALISSLAGIGVDWHEALHVTATGSLAREVRRDLDVAIPLQVVMDLVHTLSYPPDWALDSGMFPSPLLLRGRSTDREYNSALKAWQGMETGHVIRVRLAFDQAIRDLIREHGTVDLSVLSRNRRAVFEAVREATSFGVDPRNMSAASEVEGLLVSLWPELERRIPVLAQPRIDLWEGRAELRIRTSEGRELEKRLRHALELAFGERDGERTIVYHGFYYYSPDQWAWFQLLREVPGISQVFVVHDDGIGEVTETWRRFFHDEIEMPSYEPSVPIAGSPSGDALRHAVAGRSFDAAQLSRTLRIVRCDNIPQFARLWSQERALDQEEARERRTYAPSASEVRRSLERLVPHARMNHSELRDVPAGRFLLAAHRCLAPATAKGIRIDPLAIVEMADSQFLGRASESLIAQLRRSMPFFDRCQTDSEWLERAGRLREAIALAAKIEPPRVDGEDDLSRISGASTSTLRQVPWMDLSANESSEVIRLIERAIAVIREFQQSHNVAVQSHFNKIWKYLEEGWRALPDENRAEVTSRLHGFARLTAEPLALDGMLDMVAMLLGAAVVTEKQSEVRSDEMAEIRDIRGLDSLGYRPAGTSVHLANMSDRSFPSNLQPSSWPFTQEGLTSGLVDPDAAELLRIRHETAGLSDLYLLWLALNEGVEPGGRITISWIVERAGATQALSPLVALMTELAQLPPELVSGLGGLPVSRVGSAAELAPVLGQVEPSPVPLRLDRLRSVTTRVRPQALAAIQACPRRFALQWVVGPSASFQMRHQHSLLYGNTLGRLEQAGVPRDQARRLTDAVWAYLTPGERATSVRKSRVKRTKHGSASPEWTLTLAGAKTGASPLDRAYQAARSGTPPPVSLLADADWGVLPPGVTRPEVCASCPVKPTCSAWVDNAD